MKQQLLASGRDLMIVAPFLGHVPFKPSADEWAKAKTQTEKDALTKRSLAHDSGASGYAGARDSLGSGTAAFDYLSDVLAAIGAFHAKSKTPPGDGGGTAARDTPAAAPKLGRLFIGCHSGGGEGMLKMPNGLRRENAAHLRPHFETPATLLRPRIEQSW